jgi:predicted nucleotidyltransferase component of viral defense system
MKTKAQVISKTLKAIVKENETLSFNELRIVVALERLVARLENDFKLAKHLIFKGGFVLLKIIESNRFTRDLDALAFEISKKDIPELVKNAIYTDLGDGLWFGDLKIKELQGHSREGALRFDCAYQIGESVNRVHKLSRIHVDIGFGDAMDGDVAVRRMKSILPGEKPVSWHVYPPEYIISEKLQTLFHRGSLNSRAKDVYDLVLLIPKIKSMSKLKEAIRNTFEIRKTAIDPSFFQSATKFDLTTLSHAWRSIRFISDADSFENCWKELLGHLKDLDNLLKK